MSNPVNDPSFWRDRLSNALAEGQPHKALYHVDPETWANINMVHKQVLSQLLNTKNHVSILDAGCGLGELVNLLPDIPHSYKGIDISPEFISYARHRHPRHQFELRDAADTGFSERAFDLAVCRSLEGMIKNELGFEAWRKIETELLRVADRLLLLNYSNPTMYRVFESSPDPKEFALVTISQNGSHLSYRPGKDGTIELYDMFVNENHRRQGIASKLITSVTDEAYGCVYGFTQIDNEAIHAVYTKLGFTLTTIPGFYRGIDGVMASKTCFSSIGKNHAD